MSVFCTARPQVTRIQRPTGQVPIELSPSSWFLTDDFVADDSAGCRLVQILQNLCSHLCSPDELVAFGEDVASTEPLINSPANRVVDPLG
jgi:hypothetical protein